MTFMTQTTARLSSFRDRAKQPFAAVVVLALAGCQTAAEVKTAEMCVRSDRAKPVFVGHVDERGTAYLGDAPKGQYDGVVGKVATALAVPRRSDYRRRVRSDCYDKKKDVWYPCAKEIKINFSEIKGLARAPKMGRAKSVALRLCEQEVRQRSPRLGGHSFFDSPDFTCRVVKEEYCPIYKATAAQKKAKKKLREERKRKTNPELERRYGPGSDCPSGNQNCIDTRGRRY